MTADANSEAADDEIIRVTTFRFQMRIQIELSLSLAQIERGHADSDGSPASPNALEGDAAAGGQKIDVSTGAISPTSTVGTTNSDFLQSLLDGHEPHEASAHYARHLGYCDVAEEILLRFYLRKE